MDQRLVGALGSFACGDGGEQYDGKTQHRRLRRMVSVA
jgi:hypothetical protein